MSAAIASAISRAFLTVAVLAANAFLMASLSRVSSRADRAGYGRVRFEPLRPVWEGIRLAGKEQGAPWGIVRGVGAVPVLAALFLVLVAFGVVPYSATLRVVRTDTAVIYLLGVLVMSVLWPFLAGWANGDSLAIVTGMRITARRTMFVSALVLSVVPVVMYAGGFDSTVIVSAQSGVWLRVVPRWFATFPMFWPSLAVFTSASAVAYGASPNGAFERSVGLGDESSLAPTPLLCGVQRLVEHAYLFIVSALTVILFFGGWTVPRVSLAGVAPLVFLVKVYAWATVVMWVRRRLPALRQSDLMALGWRWLVPLSFVWIVVCALLTGLFDLGQGVS